MVLAFTAAILSWIKDYFSNSLLSDANGEFVSYESKVGAERICHCTDLQLQQLTTHLGGNFSEVTTYISSEHLSSSFSGYEVPCPIAAIRCAKKSPISGSFRLLAMLHSSLERAPKGGIVRTRVRDALEKTKKVEIDTYMSQRGKYNLSQNYSILSSSSSIGSGMIYLKNGCVRVSGCRKLGIKKMSFLSRKNMCSGYTDQTISNDTICISEARGHNRMRCHLEHSTKRQFYAYLWVASLGPYYTFQHFILDKLPELLVARELLASIREARYLTILDRRSLEILEFLGFNKEFIATASPEKSSCAQNLLVNTPLPGKYGFAMLENFPRPPELFKYASTQFSLEYGMGVQRDLIIYLERGKTSLSSNHISNIKDVKSTLKQNSRKLKVVSIDPALMKVKDLVKVMQSAKIVVGVHGGQMANIMFAQPDTNTSIIEIAGRQTYWKSYYYNGMGSVFDYHLVPRLCKSKGAVIHPNDVDLKFGRCSSNLFVSIDDLKMALNKALEY